MKTIQKYLLGMCILTLGAFSSVQGQSPDRIQLKDGTFVRGTILEYFPDSHIKIRTEAGDIHEFKSDQLTKLREGKVKSVPVKSRGYFNHTSFGLNFGRSYNVLVDPSFHFVNGYQRGRFQVGLGTGLESFDRTVFLPLFAQGNYFFREGGFSPYVGINGGYTWQLGSNNNYYPYDYYLGSVKQVRSRGPMGGIQLGIRNYTNRTFGYTIGLGYRLQVEDNESLEYFWNGQDQQYHWVTEVTTRHRIEVRFGIFFN